MMLRITTAIVLATVTLAACSAPASSPDAGDDEGSPDAAPGVDADPDACPAGPAGAACVIALAEAAAASCDPTMIARVEAELAARHGWLPLWAAGRALFATDGAAEIAGAFNAWTPAALPALCDRALHVGILAVASGRHGYKLVVGDTWQLDPRNLAFTYDDFAGNPDGRNSLLATPDSGLGQLIAFPEPLCSTELGNCRAVTAYLPRGYSDPANADRRYPVIYMHDGQNVFDDHDCCFGHTGWEVNVAIDADVASGALAEVIVVAADHGGAARNDEYGWTLAAGGRMETFMAFQTQTVQPAAEALLRIDTARRYVAGSSLGGLVSMRLALAYPTTYAGAAALSGAFWPGQDTGTALRDVLPTIGKQPLAIYLDHGGTAQGGGDGYADSIEIRDLAVGLGWDRTDSPACTRGPDALCYHHEPGATHDELAWRDRTWRFLRFFAGP
jgi:predicted alpha/beta superfamily hydrolase